MTAKYPSVRRRVEASSLTLSLLLALGATSAGAAETVAAGTANAVAGNSATIRWIFCQPQRMLRRG